MTSERDKCGLSSLLPGSCRGRAEAFARNLQNRLSSLGSQDSSTDERSWLGPHEKPIALSQPILNLETEKYVDLDSLQSPCSPQEEIEETELHRLLKNVVVRTDTIGDCLCPKLNGKDARHHIRTNGTLLHHHSVDSDTDVFYDLDSPTQPYYTNGLKTSESSKSIDSETGIDVNSQGTSSSNQSDPFATSLDCTPQPSISDDMFTLSLGDESSLVNASIASEEDNCEGCEKMRHKQNKRGTKKEETDYRNSTNDEGYSNGDVLKLKEESDTYVSVLPVRNELVVECRINTEENILEEVNEERLTNGNDGIVDDTEDIEDEIDDEIIPRVRRCSSLKTGKTPPGTPGRKKIVRFADVLGLDLADVRTFLDEVPKVPKSAYDDLSDADLSDGSDLNSLVQTTKYHGIKTDRILIPQFEQPSGLPNFLDLVRDNQVCLENALVDDPILFLIKGTVRVRNLDFNKSVHIRYTLDTWKTFSDVQATYVDNSCDGFSDRFSFKIYAHTLTVGQKLEFAVRFQCKGCQYWDGNGSRNYSFQCLPSAASSTSAPIGNHGLADWGASFY